MTDFGEAIALINRLERFDPTDETMPRLGIEGFTSAKFTVPRVSLGFGFRSALEPLIKEDFDAAAAAIDVLASPSVRGFCRLEAARLVFESAVRTAQQTKVQRSPSRNHAQEDIFVKH